MRKLALVLPPLLLAGCGGPAPPGAEAEIDAVGSAIEITADTHLNPSPPVYESTPLPAGLVWETNDSDPVFTSPEAKRGGTFTDYWLGFPLTLRLYGPDSNSGQSVPQRRSATPGLVEFHPNTLNPMPLMATHWAFGDDGRTVYYRLDPRARWSDGEPVVADDYLFFREMMLSDYVLDPFGKNYMTEVVVDVRKHDDFTISVVGAAALPREELMVEYVVEATPRHFHVLDENWVTDYDWKVEPNAGPYQISAVENGRFIEFTRKDDWWGDELKYNQNRYNAETLRFEIIRDANVAYEYFLRGELDRYVFDTLPARWHERARGEDFDKGYIHRIEFYNELPRDQRALWLNTDDPILADRNVRLGLAHSINMDRVLETIFRGDYERMQIQHEGFFFGYTNTELAAREFDVDKAGEYFDAAGWSEYGRDGIRVRDSRRLSLTISYGTDDHTPWLVVIREEARKAGVELNLQLLDTGTWGTQVGEKTHQILVLTFRPNTFAPSYWQGFHSENAHIPQTNNITNTDIPELDELIDEYDAATSLATRVDLSHRIQEIIYDHVPMIPTYKIPFIRETYWRWLRLPEWHSVRTANEVFSPIGHEPYVGGLFWIDEAMKADTLAARRAGRTFPPVDIVDTTWRTP
jgi:microcin C transport system substrate-binding protein